MSNPYFREPLKTQLALYRNRYFEYLRTKIQPYIQYWSQEGAVLTDLGRNLINDYKELIQWVDNTVPLGNEKALIVPRIVQQKLAEYNRGGSIHVDLVSAILSWTEYVLRVFEGRE